MRSLAFLLLAGVLPCIAREIPAGTQLQVRLAAPLSSTSAKAGQTFSAVLIAPVILDGELALNAGATISGTIQDVTQNDDSTRARLTLQFSGIADAAGHRAKLSATLTSVDNARETVSDGAIVGIAAGDTLSTRLDQGISKVAERYSGFAGLLEAAKGAAIAKTDASISYPAGVEMTIALSAALDWNWPVEPPALGTIDPAPALAALVNSQPFRTVTDKTNKPSDITNLMFLGTLEQIRSAFEAAGWSESNALGGKSKFETFQAMASMKGYTEAPMSVLILDGRPPDLALEKANNTFESRHHLRIWRRPDTFHDKPVWVCSSTHDTGIGFSEKERTFIHKLDSDIDRERAKVVSDLVFTGKVQALALVARDSVPLSTFNGTGDPIATDASMAVIEF